jgi:hypothetical protein
LLGLNGSGDQQRAIDALRSSPLYQSLYRNGVNTSLANASATGGLRGGNEQHSLYDVGSDTLAQVIQNQLQNLGGLSGQGLQATQQSGSFGGQAAGDVASLQNLIGRIQAGGILGKSAVNGQLWNTGANLGQDIISQLMSAFGGGGNPFGGGGNGSDLMSSLGQMQGSNAALFGG